MNDAEIASLMGAGFNFSQVEDYDLAMQLARRVAQASAEKERKRCLKVAEDTLEFERGNNGGHCATAACEVIVRRIIDGV
jgi:hypothetical protein